MDNNCFAVALVSAIGPAIALFIAAKTWYQRAAAAASGLAILHTAMLTFSRGGMVGMLAILAVAILPAPLSAALARVRHPKATSPTPAIVDVVKHTASPNCIIAGQTDLYAQYFMSYPKFVGTRPTEVLIGSTYYDLQNDLVGYWRKKDPDVVFGKIDPSLEAFLRDAKYTAVADGVWRKPGSCQ